MHFDVIFRLETVMNLIELFDSEPKDVIVENIKAYENNIGKVYMTELKNVPPAQNDYQDTRETF